MCGIVGLFLKNKSLQGELGALVAPMLAIMSDRGPDSAGFAVYGAGKSGHLKFTVRLKDEPALERLIAALETTIEARADVVLRGSHAVVTVPTASERALRTLIAAMPGDVHLVGTGRRMEIFKDVGRPEIVTEMFDLPAMRGTHAIGHTRMATESAVTTDGAHPFSTATDECLVHNGSLSNHNAVRRMLRREGLTFETENDSEVAAGYLTWRLREGFSLREALEASLKDLDGFYTFLVGTETGFAVLRDPISCKPAVMAETDDYVAFGSEYRALAGLPGIELARAFEPEPATVYVWEHA